MPVMKRKWAFYIKYADGNAYLDLESNEIDYEEAYNKSFIGDITDAEKEADRRANLWEDKNKGSIARIVYESLGKVE